MSGLSLFNLLEYSMNNATFEAVTSNDGDRLLQVAGLKIQYNPNVPIGEPKLVAVDVWNRQQDEWKSLKPNHIFKFATDDYMCNVYDLFPDLLGVNVPFSMQGEEGGAVGDILVQDAVVQFLQQLALPYNTSISGRLVENTEGQILQLLKGQDDCDTHEYLSDQLLACLPCPDTSHVTFSDDVIELYYESNRTKEEYLVENAVVAGANLSTSASYGNNRTMGGEPSEKVVGRIVLANRATRNFTAVIKQVCLPGVPLFFALSDLPLTPFRNYVSRHKIRYPPG